MRSKKMSFIEMKNIRKDFGKNTILHGVNMNLDKGQVISIIGPSGAGKSTLLRCLNHLEIIQGGSICVDGEYLAKEENGKVVYAPENEIRGIILRMGMVFQSFNLFPHMTVLDNILAAPIYVKGKKRAELLPLAETLLEKVGLSNKKDVYPGRLSGGQKQRALIARALCATDKLLILDEPITGLDPSAIQDFYNIIRKLNREEQVAILMVSHDMANIVRQAGKILHLQQKALFWGTVQDYLKSGIGNQFLGGEEE